MSKDMRDLYVKESLKNLRLKRTIRALSKALSQEKADNRSSQRYNSDLWNEIENLRGLPATVEAQGNASAAANAAALLTGLRASTEEQIPTGEVISFLEGILKDGQ